MVESQLEKTLIALQAGDAASIKGVSKLDKKVNKMEMQIDEECTQILAKRQPTAGDLRLIIATGKSVRDLERAGDEAELCHNNSQCSDSGDTCKSCEFMGAPAPQNVRP